MEAIAGLIVQRDFLNLTQTELNELKDSAEPAAGLIGSTSGTLYRRSLYRVGPAIVAMARIPESEAAEPTVAGPAGAAGGPQRRLVVLSPEPIHLGFHGVSKKIGAVYAQEVLPTAFNIGPLWECFPWTKPVSLRNERTTIGMGDRIGLATPGHVRAARKYVVAPVLAQQSIRELAFTGRAFADVVSDAAFLVFQEGYETGYGADGDHLKSIADIDQALARSMPMTTLDLTDFMHPEIAGWSESRVDRAFARLPSDFRSRVEREYQDQTLRVGQTNIAFDGALAKRCATMYGDALAYGAEVNNHLERMTAGAFDLEISIDETTTPTLPSHHLFIARELERRGVQVSSLAPRFVGKFEKGIDYVGDLAEFETQFKIHAEIARTAGGYKVSIHSGSDKFSAYPVIGRETKMRFHLKTAGTNWLESLRTIAQTEPELYRLIHRRSFDYFPEATKSYVIGADLDAITPLEDRSDTDLPAYLDENNCRQLLHISYGGLLRDPEVREAYFRALHVHEDSHVANVERQMDRHLETLGVDRR
ncbi:MAG: tagaturonate epimerase family protein [Spirochaetia bacterium]